MLFYFIAAARYFHWQTNSVCVCMCVIKIKSSIITLLFNKIIIFLILCFNETRRIINLQNTSLIQNDY